MGKEDLPQNDVEWADALDGVAWGSNDYVAPDQAAHDQQATEIANRPEPDQGLFRRS